MLVAASDRQFGPSRLRAVLILERRFRLHLVLRDRLVYDTKFAARGIGGEVATFYAVIRGNVQIGGGEVLGPGRAYLLDASEFEAVAPGAQHVRTWGEPSIVLDLQLRLEDVQPPIGLAHGPVTVGEATWAALRALAEGLEAGTLADEAEAKTLALVAQLVEDGVLAASVPATVADEPEPLRRLWSGLQPLYTNQATSASIFEIKKVTGMSIRQLARDIKLLTRTFGLPGEGFRDTVKVMRLRTAVLLLSSPGATATEVARQVGYKSLEAMGRAFRDAGLPAPSVIHEQVRFEGSPVATGA